MIKFYTKKSTNRTLQISSLIIVATIAITGLFIYQNNNANAEVTGWMAGRIIDDSVFTNYNSMSAAQIQTFLNNQVSNCDTNGTQPASDFGRPDLTHAQYAATRGWQAPPYICLKNYTNNGKTAAQLIYDTAQKYQINPKVFLVLLQKEQSLVTDSWPLNIPQYRSATGYGCPDTAPCDSQYYGLPNQLDWAGKMYHAIMTNSPTWYTPYELGNNYIQYNPTTSCGGSTVFIQNRATQALYNYTPYQPNSATLSSSWGAAVTCGAYGNLNFYRYYTKWFGAATSAATYGYSVVSKDIYSDYTYQTKMATPTLVTPGQEFYIKIVLKNTGNQAWYSNNLRLGTADPKNRPSVFVTSDWLSSGRPAAMSGDFITGGNNATFTFKAKAPTNLGNYQESFQPLIEDYRWIGTSFTIPITVTSLEPYYSVQTQSFDAYSDSAMTQKIDSSKITKYTNSKIYIKTIIKNTGNQTLPANTTKIATTNPYDRNSVFSDTSWLTQSRVVASKNNIPPQTTGTFIFSLTTPNTPLVRTQEQFGLVIEGQEWLSDNIGIISIQTNQRPPSALTLGQAITIGNRLVSKNELYRLILQGDGNLVLYSPTRAIWSSQTLGKGGIRLVMQGDGNLVLYTKNGTPVWDSKTSGKGKSSLYLQGDGNLVIYGPSGYTWATWTSEVK